MNIFRGFQVTHFAFLFLFSFQVVFFCVLFLNFGCECNKGIVYFHKTRNQLKWENYLLLHPSLSLCFVFNLFNFFSFVEKLNWSLKLCLLFHTHNGFHISISSERIEKQTIPKSSITFLVQLFLVAGRFFVFRITACISISLGNCLHGKSFYVRVCWLLFDAPFLLSHMIWFYMHTHRLK